MQTAVFTFSPSVHHLKPKAFSSLQSPPLRFHPLNLSSPKSALVPPPSFGLRFSSVGPAPPPSASAAPLSNGDSEGFDVKSKSVPESALPVAGDAPESSGFAHTLQLGLLFGLWYLFNIYFNIYNKKVLKGFHFPLSVTAAQFAAGTTLVTLMWIFNIHKRPKIKASQLATIIPLAAVHTLGNLFTNMSLGKVAVSFTHTIKALEPFFSVILSSMFLGDSPSLWVVASLMPIVGGVALASLTEASFNWSGFWSAMASNLTNQSRNVLSKKLMTKKEETLDNINLFSIITIMSFIILAPAAFLMEGFKFSPEFIQSSGLNLQQFYAHSLVAALCFHAYQQVSYMILQRVSPVTHSVGNCVKRVVVIVSSVVVFQTPVSAINSIGTGIALAGVFLYSRVKGIKSKKPKSE